MKSSKRRGAASMLPERRGVSDLLNRMVALDASEDGPEVEAARARLREEAEASAMRLVTIEMTDKAIPDPDLERLPRAERDRIMAITEQMFVDPAPQQAELERLVARYPHIPMLRNHLATALSASGDAEGAAEVFAETVRRFPTYVFAFGNHIMHLLHK